MNNIAIIPARGGSKGIPKKNIIDFCGEPLIYWTIRQAFRSDVTTIYVSTEDAEIGAVVRSFGFGDRVRVIDRPVALAKDTSTSEAALSHVLGTLRHQPDLVAFLQATSPLRKLNDIDSAFCTMYTENLDSLFSASEVDDITLWDDKYSSVTYDWKNRGRRQDRPKFYVENGSIFIFKPEVLLRNNNRLGGVIGRYLMESWQSFEIDDLEGLDLCEYYMRKKILFE